MFYTIVGAIIGGVVLRTLSNIFGGRSASQPNMLLASLTPRSAWMIFGVLLGGATGFCYGGYRIFIYDGPYLPWK